MLCYLQNIILLTSSNILLVFEIKITPLMFKATKV